MNESQVQAETKGQEKAPANTSVESKGQAKNAKKQPDGDGEDSVEERLQAMKEATEAMRIENDRKEALNAEKNLGGESEAGQPSPEPVKETPEEYAERFQRGEVNPLEDDNAI